MTAQEIQFILSILGTAVVVIAAMVSGFATVKVARENRRARQDKTPADTNEATRIANDLIFRLLDKANDEVQRTGTLLERMTGEAEKYRDLADLVPGLRDDLERAKQERDRLRKAIQFLEAKARDDGSITYAEVVEWAQLALDPHTDSALFDSHLTTLPDGLEDTVTTL